MAPKQGDDVRLEAPTTSSRIGCDSVAETARKSDGSSDGTLMSMSENRTRHNQKCTTLVRNNATS
jgi:hypothetical protein